MKNRNFAIILLVILGLFAALYIYFALFKTPDEKPHKEEKSYSYEPRFRKDAELYLLKPGEKIDTIATLDIEIADDEYEITTGLMYRKSMEQNRGMLFIFPDERMRSFWMKNTHIPLDIIFIGKDKKIVTIQKNTVPFSETSIPSSDIAKYVLEINAGYSDILGLKNGDRIEFRPIN